MKIIIGLGNPGAQYKNTRHNFGFIALDFLRRIFSAPTFKLNKKLAAEISKFEINGEEMILAKPQTFMNNSGEAAQKILIFYKLDPEDLVVMNDDLDLEFGKIKLSKNRGSAGHRGVGSIINRLGTKNFTRLRLGISRPPQNISPETYVLQNFSSREKEKLKDILKEAQEFIDRDILNLR